MVQGLTDWVGTKTWAQILINTNESLSIEIYVHTSKQL